MSVVACLRYSCLVFAVLVSVLLAPLLSSWPQVVRLDNVQEWGLKGPYLSQLPPNMRGVYYLDGNQMPWTESNRCNKTEARNKVICRHGWKRSNLVVFDSSHMAYHVSKRYA